MANHGRLLPARKGRNGSRHEESALLRTAESLGRAIGVLQRQLERAARHDGHGVDGDGDGDGDGMRAPVAASPRPAAKRAATARAAAPAPARQRTAAQEQKTTGRGGAKVRSTADRKSKRAAKSAAARKRTK